MEMGLYALFQAEKRMDEEQERELAATELHKIKTLRELADIDRQIKDYIERK